MLKRIRNWLNSNKVHEGATTELPAPYESNGKLISFDDKLNERLQDPEFKKEYDRIGDTIGTCPVCSKTYDGYDALQQHYQAVHLHSLLSTIPGTEDGPVVKCPKCGLHMSETEYDQFHRGTNNCPEHDDQGDQNVQYK